MTVEDLIAQLKEFPQDAPIWVYGCYGAQTPDIISIDLDEGRVCIVADIMTG